jgi:hypothetical protein
MDLIRFSQIPKTVFSHKYFTNRMMGAPMLRLFILEGKGVPMLNQAPHHDDKGEVEVQLHTLLTLALDADEWSASHFNHFIPGGRVPGIH